MKKVNYNIVIVSAVIVFIVIAILIIFLKKNKKSSKNVILPKSLKGQVTEAEEAEATALAAKLYQDMKGLNVFGHNMALYKELNNKDDRMLAIIAATFESNYNGSLAEWLANESFLWGELRDQDALIQSIVTRLLNLKTV